MARKHRKKRISQRSEVVEEDSLEIAALDDKVWSKNEKMFLAGIVFVFFVSFYKMFSFGIFGDEVQYMHDTKVFSQNMFLDSFWQPAGFYLISMFFYKMGGVMWIRLTSFLFFVLFAVVSYRYLPLRFTRMNKLLFILSVVSIPIVMEYSRVAYLDMGIMFLAFFAFLLYLRAFELHDDKYIVYAGLVLFFATFYKLTVLPFIFGMLIVLVLKMRKENMLGSLFSGRYFLFMVLVVSAPVLLYLVDSQFSFPLSFSNMLMNPTDQHQGSAMKVGASDVFDIAIIKNVLAVVRNVPYVAFFYYMLIFGLLIRFSRAGLKLKGDRKDAFIIFIVYVFFLLVSGKFPDRYAIALFPFFMFFAFDAITKNERLLLYVLGLFVVLDITMFVFDVGMPINLINNKDLGPYTMPAEPLIEMTGFINSKTGPNDYVVISDFALGPLIDAHKLSGTNIVEREGQKVSVAYVYPAIGTKYIVLDSRNDVDMAHMSFMKNNYIAVGEYQQIMHDGVRAFYLFEVPAEMTHADAPKAMPTYPYYSFLDSIFDKSNYGQHAFE